jgi:hypothetical protein
MITVPLKGGAVNAHQTQSVQLGDNFLELRISYVTRFPGWSMDVLREGVVLIAGAMLVPGAEITKNYNAGIGTLKFVGDEPTLDNLGQSNSLVWESD